jgi:hypothetical protein
VEAAGGERTPARGPSVSAVNLSPYYAVVEHQNRVDSGVVITGKAGRRLYKAPAEPSTL